MLYDGPHSTFVLDFEIRLQERAICRKMQETDLPREVKAAWSIVHFS